jgi:hypothetical protein
MNHSGRQPRHRTSRRPILSWTNSTSMSSFGSSLQKVGRAQKRPDPTARRLYRHLTSPNLDGRQGSGTGPYQTLPRHFTTPRLYGTRPTSTGITRKTFLRWRTTSSTRTPAGRPGQERSDRRLFSPLFFPQGRGKRSPKRVNRSIEICGQRQDKATLGAVTRTATPS